MKVKEIMTKKVVTVTPENNIITVVKLLLKNKIHSLPVVNENNRVVGIVSEKDIFTKEPACDYLPMWSGLLGIARYNNKVTPEEEVKMIKLIQVSASEIMTPDPLIIGENENISELIRIFRETKYKTLPVLDDKGKLSGIVSIVDVVRKIEWK